MRYLLPTYSFLFLLLMFACKSPDKIKAKDGRLDLSQQAFQKEYLLDGEWEFYWKQYYNPENFLDENSKTAPLIVNVPFSWTNYQFEDEKLSAYGYGTYRLQVLLPEKSPQTLGLYIPKIWSANKVWINDELVYESGKLSKSSKGYENKMIEALVQIQAKDKKLDMVVQVANYDMFIAGIIQGFRLGEYKMMLEKKELNSSWNLMWIGVLLVMGFYHIILYYFRSKNKSTLFFGIITLLIAMRLVVFGEHYLYEYLKHHIGWLTFAIQSKTYYIATFALIPLGLSYVVCLYPNEPKRKLFGLSNDLIIKVSSIITIVYTLFLLFAPPAIFTQTLIAYQGIIGIFLLYLVYVLLSAFFNKKNETVFQVVGVLTMVFAGINDGLHAQGIELVGQLELMPIAFGIFLSLQFFIIAKRFSRAFNEVEDLSENLEKKVIERTKELIDKNEEIEQQKEILRQNSEALQHAYKQITDSVKYAKRIQRAILGNSSQLQSLIADSFVLFLPKDIVSGDFYVFKQIGNRKIIITADATGHGVPGAFMTVVGTELLNEIIEQNPSAAPHQMLNLLDSKLTSLLQTQQQDNKKVNDGMDMSILILDDALPHALYAGAKMPLYLVRNNVLTQIDADKYPIGGAAQYKRGKSFETKTIDLQKGDVIYISSDGYQDQFGGSEKRKFMKRKFKELLVKIHNMPSDEQKEYLETTFRNWKKDQAQTDDVLVVGIKV